jgi:hypothetical protein
LQALTQEVADNQSDYTCYTAYGTPAELLLTVSFDAATRQLPIASKIKGDISMKKYTFPTMSILAATAAIGIASVAIPVHAAPGFFTGLVGAACAATQNHFSKITVFNNGAVANKSTTGIAIVSCPAAVERGTTANVFVSWNKRDSQTLSCTLHRRNFDYLSGASSTQNTTAVGAGFFQFNGVTADFFNSAQCTIPRNNGNGQNSVNGVFWAN